MALPISCCVTRMPHSYAWISVSVCTWYVCGFLPTPLLLRLPLAAFSMTWQKKLTGTLLRTPPTHRVPPPTNRGRNQSPNFNQGVYSGGYEAAFSIKGANPVSQVKSTKHLVRACNAGLFLPCDRKKYGQSTLSLIHISEPTRRTPISYAVFCLKKKK